MSNKQAREAKVVERPLPGHSPRESKVLRFNKQEANFKSSNFSSALPAGIESFWQVLRESLLYIYLLFFPCFIIKGCPLKSGEINLCRLRICS